MIGDGVVRSDCIEKFNHSLWTNDIEGYYIV